MKTGLVAFDWTIVFQIINTLILFLVLRKLLFKPVTEFMNKRQNDIAASLEEAAQKNQEAEQKREEYGKKLELAQQEGREIIQKASKRAQDKADDIVKEARNEANRLVERAEAEIKRNNEKAINDIKNEMTSLAVMAAGKVIDQNLDEKKHEKMIQQFIQEVGDARWQN